MNLPPNALTLDRLIKVRAFTRGAELGVRRGELTASLLERHPGLHMLAVDLWAPHPTFAEQHDHEGDYARFVENTRAFGLGPEARVITHRLLTTDAAKLVPDASLDFVFVDATHTYAALKADLEAWLPKVRCGGLIAGHDYHPHWDQGGVIRCVDELLPRRWLGDDSCWFAWKDEVSAPPRPSTLRIAVYSLTRDRLEFTRPCFESLWSKAGALFDHYVLDNGSVDGTARWLEEHRPHFKEVVTSTKNLGIARGCNRLLDLIAREAEASGPYDLVIKVDNDCELVTDDLLPKLVGALQADPDWKARRVLSPRVLGLVHQPARERYETLGGHRVGVTGGVGGIFLPVAGSLLGTFRYPDDLPLGHGDDVYLCARLREQGATIGYVEDLEVRHYLTTVGQWNVDRRYCARKASEVPAHTAAPRPTFEVVEHTPEAGERLPVTVIVPLSASRRPFFEEKVLPSLLRNRPEKVVVVSDVGSGVGGASAKRNAGFARASTPCVFFCDDDVVADDACLARLCQALDEHPRAGYAYCSYEGVVVPPATHPLGERFTHEARPFDAGALQRQNLASTMSLVRAAVFPGFDEELARLQDWDLWLTLLDRGIEGVAVPERLFTTYYLDQGITATQDGDAARAAVLARHDLAHGPGEGDDGMAVSRRTVRALEELARPYTLRRIVELGTGAGRSLATLVAHAPRHAELVTVDHEARFLRRAEETLAHTPGAERVSLVHAPLEPSDGDHGQKWYSRRALDKIPGPIDLLFVDGPEGAIGREPALSAFVDRLSPRASIVLDDAHRPHEREVLRAWERELRARGHELLVDLFPTDRGLARIQLLGAASGAPPRVEVAPDPGDRAKRQLVKAARAVPRGSTVLDLGCGLGEATARALADAVGGRVLGVRLASELPLERASVDLVLTDRRLEGLAAADLARTSREVERVLRPGGLVLLSEVLGREGEVGSTRRDALLQAFAWAALGPKGVVPVGDALLGLLAGHAPARAHAGPASALVVDADDFHETNAGLELLFRIKGAVPDFKVTLFTIVGRCSKEFLRGVATLDWVDLVPHGWLHETPHECQDWSDEQAREYLARLEDLGLTKGFKAPGWQISDGTYRALLERGYWVADQRYNDWRRPPGLRAYLLEDEAGRPVAGRRHYHVQNACGNGLAERLPELLALRGPFAFVKDVVGHEARELARA